ncbi:transposable element Tcb2 transposase [Trichonephila clavipes]|nr:transposable element Tcb2 transposase [Trichonephila clavipes]
MANSIHAPMKLLGAVDVRRYPRAENRVWSDQEDHEERGSKDRAASTCGPYSDSFNDTSRRKRSNCPQTISRHLAEANLKSKGPFRALPLTPEPLQLRLQWYQVRSMWNVTDWLKVVFSDESRFVLGQMITVYGCGGALQDNARPPTARVAQDFLRHFQTLPWRYRSPVLSPVEHVWDQLKRQMPSCYSVHDLELAVQDLWAICLRTT